MIRGKPLCRHAGRASGQSTGGHDGPVPGRHVAGGKLAGVFCLSAEPIRRGRTTTSHSCDSAWHAPAVSDVICAPTPPLRILRAVPRHAVRGGLAEWSKAAVLKTVEPRGSRGSNPWPTAIHTKSAPSGRFLCVSGGSRDEKPGGFDKTRSVLHRAAQRRSPKGRNSPKAVSSNPWPTAIHTKSAPSGRFLCVSGGSRDEKPGGFDKTRSVLHRAAQRRSPKGRNSPKAVSSNPWPTAIHTKSAPWGRFSRRPASVQMLLPCCSRAPGCRSSGPMMISW